MTSRISFGGQSTMRISFADRPPSDWDSSWSQKAAMSGTARGGTPGRPGQREPKLAICPRAKLHCPTATTAFVLADGVIALATQEWSSRRHRGDCLGGESDRASGAAQAIAVVARERRGSRLCDVMRARVAARRQGRKGRSVRPGSRLLEKRSGRGGTCCAVRAMAQMALHVCLWVQANFERMVVGSPEASAFDARVRSDALPLSTESARRHKQRHAQRPKRLDPLRRRRAR
jgi:hypothetical protein